MIDLAKDLMSQNNWLILDTETTGLDDQAEACQIGILAPTGEVILDTLVRPKGSIPYDASRIHGITDEMVADAPTFMDIFPRLVETLSNTTIVVYNAAYDARILEQSWTARNPSKYLLESELFPGGRWIDVMDPYAEFWGDWSDWHQSYKWQSLENACRQQGIAVNGAHSAIGDCRMTLALLRKVAQDEHTD